MKKQKTMRIKARNRQSAMNKYHKTYTYRHRKCKLIKVRNGGRVKNSRGISVFLFDIEY